MEINNLEYHIIGNISYVSADINGIQYNIITPKFILNRDIFNEQNLNINFNDIKYKSSSYTLQGINGIDIDWNGALINDTNINKYKPF